MTSLTRLLIIVFSNEVITEVEVFIYLRIIVKTFIVQDFLIASIFLVSRLIM